MRRVARHSAAVIASIVTIGTACGPVCASARESGVQGTPDGKRILVNKDVDTSRYAIAQDQDDRSATGNVFFTDDRAPAFLFCAALGGTSFGCSIGDPCPSSGRQSGIQRRPDGKGVLVSKDVAGSRYAITSNEDDGSLTGNVFFTDGRPPVFLFCESLGNSDYSCSSGDRCTDTICPPYTFVGTVTLPSDFFSISGECPIFQPVGTVDLPSDFFSVPSATRGALSVGARQVIGSNPFGDLTKITVTSGAAARAAAVAPASTSRNEPAACPGGGGATLQCEVDEAPDGSTTTVATLDYEQCVFPQADGGFKVQSGLFRYTVPDFGDCDPLPYDTGREELEERAPFVNAAFDAAGNLVERETDQGSSLITFGAACRTGSGSVRNDVRMRDIDSTVDEAFFDGGEVHVLSTFDHVDQTILHSSAPACASTYTIRAGTITTDDGRTGESFTTSYGKEGGIQFTFDDSVLRVSGGLTSACSGAQSSFTFDTVEAPLFDATEPNGCPRGGRIEISSNGTVIGELVFTPSGGVQLTELDGRTTAFASCNDPDFLLRCE